MNSMYLLKRLSAKSWYAVLTSSPHIEGVHTPINDELLCAWALSHDRLVSVGNTSTYIRPQGHSIVDITWSSPSLIDHLGAWRVLGDVETLSDHLYVFMCFEISNVTPFRDTPGARWNFKKLDASLFMENLEWNLQSSVIADPDSVVDMVRWMDKIIREVYNVYAENFKHTGEPACTGGTMRSPS